jgi:hypothetical protein
MRKEEKDLCQEHVQVRYFIFIPLKSILDPAAVLNIARIKKWTHPNTVNAKAARKRS